MQEKLHKAYPPTPAVFDDRMRQTLNSLPARHRPLRAVVAVALAATVMLGGLAFAVSQSALLQSIFRNTTPTPQAEELVVQLGTAVAQNGVTLTIDEYLLDGSNLYVRWTAVSDRKEPLMLLFSDLETPFEAETEYDDNPVHWLFGSGLLLDADHPTHSAVSRLRFDDACPKEAFDAGLTIALMKPTARILDRWESVSFTDTPTLLLSDYGQDGAVLSPASTLIVEDDTFSHISCDELYETCENPSFEDMLTALERCGYARTDTLLPVRFTVTPAPEDMVHTRVAGQNTFSFDRFNIIVEDADFTAAGAHLKLRIIPSDSEDPWLSRAAELWFEVLPNGQLADNAFIQDKWIDNGALICEIEVRAGGSIPKYVRIIPTDENGRLQNQYAFEFRLTQTPS